MNFFNLNDITIVSHEKGSNKAFVCPLTNCSISYTSAYGLHSAIHLEGDIDPAFLKEIELNLHTQTITEDDISTLLLQG